MEIMYSILLIMGHAGLISSTVGPSIWGGTMKALASALSIEACACTRTSRSPASSLEATYSLRSISLFWFNPYIQKPSTKKTNYNVGDSR